MGYVLLELGGLSEVGEESAVHLEGGLGGVEELVELVGEEVLHVVPGDLEEESCEDFGQLGLALVAEEELLEAAV